MNKKEHLFGPFKKKGQTELTNCFFILILCAYEYFLSLISIQLEKNQKKK